jgi:tape measure domain-containing protein
MAETLSTGSIGVDIQPFIDALKQAQAEDAKLTQAVLANNAAQGKSFSDLAEAAVVHSNRLAAQVVAYRDAQAATRSAAEAVRELTAANRELERNRGKDTASDEYKRLTREIEKNNARIKEAKQAIQENKQAVEQERAAVQTVQEARRKETNETKLAAAAARDVAAATKQEAAAAKEAAAAAKQASSQQSDAGITLGKSSGGFLGTLRALGPAVAAAFSIAAIKEFASAVNESSKQLDAVKSKLNFATGSPEAATRELSFIRAEAKRLGLDLTSTGVAYGSFVAAAKEGNVPLVEARRTFLAVAGAASTLKLSAADTQGVLTALQQIVSKGTVSSEELRGQIGERLPGAFSIAARSIGVTEKQLQKLLESGSLVSSQFLPKFTRELEKTFGDGSAAAADALQANENRITNEWQAFLQRFEGLAGATTGVLAKFAAQANKFLDSFTTAGRLRQATQGAQQGIKDYGDTLDKLFTAEADRAKKNGEDVGKAVAGVATQQGLVLQKQLTDAQQALAKFDTSTKEGALFQGNFRGGSAAFNAARADALQRVELIKGEQAAINERADAFKKAADAEATQTGRIIALRALIAANTKTRDETLDTVEGNKERVRLNALLKEENKLLDELLGKEERARRARQYSYESQLRALLQERATLTSLAGKASEQMADDATARAKAVFDEGLRQVDVVQAKLVQRENDLRKAAAKVGGGAVRRLGEKADGVVDGVQEQQLATLRIAALNKYYTDLYKITEAREQRLFDLRIESDAKEIEAIDRKYERLIAAAKDGIEKQALAEAQAREQLALKAQQEDKRISQTAAAGNAAAALVGQTYGQGTGVSVFEARQAEAQALLDIEKKAAQDSLNNTLNKTGKAAEIERAALEAQLARIQQQQKKLDIQERLSNFSIYKLILGENDSEETRAALDKVANQVVSSLNQIVGAEEQAAAARAQIATQNISELTAQLAGQIQLNQEGSASNIKGLQDQINQERALRRAALDEQRKAAKEKVVIDALTQASSIATAAAELFAVLAPLGPFGVVAAIASSALLIGSFVAAKAEAYSAASNLGGSGGSYFTGGYTGDGNPREVSTAQGSRPYEYHKGEFIMNHELTDQYRKSLFEPLHTGRPQDIDWSHPKLRAILPDFTLPATLRVEKAEAARVQHEHSFLPMKQEFGQMHERLQAIEQTNAQMAGRWDSHTLPDGRVLLIDPATGSTHYITQR